MAWQRFDDIEYRVVEELELRRRCRPRRTVPWTLAGVATLIVAGGLVAGAGELTSSLSSRTTAASAVQQRARSRQPRGVLATWRNAPHMHYGAAGIPPAGNG